MRGGMSVGKEDEKGKEGTHYCQVICYYPPALSSVAMYKEVTDLPCSSGLRTWSVFRSVGGRGWGGGEGGL